MTKRSPSGFTLVELLFSLAVFGVIFGSLGPLLIGSSAASHAGRRLTAGYTLAQDKIEDLRATNPSLISTGSDTVTATGAPTAPTGEYYLRDWTVDAGPNAATRQITVSATWYRNGEAHYVKLQTVAGGF